MIVDIFGGPGGWAEGLRMIGLTEIGIELDPWACATRRAAGHPVIRADVAICPLSHLAGRVEGLIASPPCQAFSAAGNGEGRRLVAALRLDIERGSWTAPYPLDVRHVLQVGRWAQALQPRWIACEQVPPALPLWVSYARWLRANGYSTWAGIINAADYGVPQTRRRAILLASVNRTVGPPAPTHAQGGAATLFGYLRPWVSMADALGWKPIGAIRTGKNSMKTSRRVEDLVPYRRSVDEPAPVVDGQISRWVFERPATTIAGDPRVFPPGGHLANDGRDNSRMMGRSETEIRLHLSEALTLQGFRPDYPITGTKTKQFEQVGNAVPPLLAAHILAAATDRTIEAAA